MLTILPILILVLAAAAILVLQRVKPGFGYAWMTGSAASLLAWGLTLAMRWIAPPALTLRGWQPRGEMEHLLVFQFDAVSWSYAATLASLALCLMLTVAARLQPNSDPRIWANNLFITGMGMLAVLSGNALTIAISWTAIDIAELVTILNSVRSGRLSSQAVAAFSIRTAGTLALMCAMILSAAQGSVLNFTAIPPSAALFILFSAGLRLGVLPLNMPYQQAMPLRRGIATALRVVSAVSSLALVAHLPQNAIPAAWQPWLLALTVLAALYGAAMWAAAKDELAGRSFWILSLAALGLGCAVQGQAQASLVWGLALILGGSMIFLYNARGRGVNVLPVLMLVSISGLPFTLTASGWVGLFGQPINSAGLFFLIAVALLWLGYIRHWMHPGEALKNREQWAQTIYPIGLAVLIIAAWFIPAASGDALFTVGMWWAGPVMLTLGALAFLLFYTTTWSRPADETPGWFAVLARNVGGRLAAISSFSWLYQLMWWIYRQVAGALQVLTVILEGEGGLLWVLVMLALLIALLKSGGGS